MLFDVALHLSQITTHQKPFTSTNLPFPPQNGQRLSSSIVSPPVPYFDCFFGGVIDVNTDSSAVLLIACYRAVGIQFVRVTKPIPNAAVRMRKIVVIMKVAFIITNNYCNFSAAERLTIKSQPEK